MIGLAREKPYPEIAVKDILHRANVGRSTFYTHFRDKHDLLESGLRDLLQSARSGSQAAPAREHLLAFSLPLLTHIDGHRQAAGPEMQREGRLAMHAQLGEALANQIADDLTDCAPRLQPRLPIELVARHVASTFVLVLNWWIESAPALTPAEANAVFRALVAPYL